MDERAIILEGSSHALLEAPPQAELWVGLQSTNRLPANPGRADSALERGGGTAAGRAWDHRGWRMAMALATATELTCERLTWT